jgi:PAS domain S-box-containing protein
VSREPRILLVEDEAVIALDLERRLERAGYEICGVADCGEDAIALFHELRPTLVLMDISIRGELDGIETARILARDHDTPVIFVTAFADDATIHRAREVSPYGYLLKPYDDRALVATIAMTLERHDADTRARLLGAAADGATVGIALADVRGASPEIQYANSSFLGLLGRSAEEVLGQPPCFAAADPQEEDVRRLKEAIAAHERMSAVVRAKRPGGETFWASVHLSPVRRRGGRVTHLLLFVADVTPLRETQLALAESERVRLVGQLSAGIAHDMNNVLGVISAFTGLALEGLDPGDSRRADLEEVLQSAQHGAFLTRKLLDFSRGSGGRKPTPSDLARVVEQTQPMARRLAGTQVEVVFHIEEASTLVALDATSIEQILLNLVANARDAMPRDGKIRVSVYSTPADSSGVRRARLEVSDHGIGMSTELCESVFRPFFTTKSRGKGTGLGLSTCRMLAERAGGTITVASELGVGTTFSVELPLLQRNVDPEAELAAQNAHAGGAVCLLVEDEPGLRETYTRALSAAGFTVFAEGTGEAALQDLDVLRGVVRLVVCDVMLPGVSGAVVLARAATHVPDAARLAISAYFDAESSPLPEDVALLQKPFLGTTLAARALELLRSAPVGELPDLPSAAVGIAPPSTIQLVIQDEHLRSALTAILTLRGHRVAASGVFGVDDSAPNIQDLGCVVLDANASDSDRRAALMTSGRMEVPTPLILLTDRRNADTARALHGRGRVRLVELPLGPFRLVEEVERALADREVRRLQSLLLQSKANAAWDPLAGRPGERLDAALAGLRLAFQPIVHARRRTVVGHQALLRTPAPATPGDALLAAEACGRVTELGERIRAGVAAALSKHPDLDGDVFIKLHPVELRSELLLRDDAPLLPHAARIVFEFTERAEIASVASVPTTLRELRDAGFRVALARLGEDYGGVSSLLRYRPDFAKLDVSLIADVPASAERRQVVRAVVDVCRRAGVRLVAEGVERSAEAEILAELGCELLQGFHIGAPALV